MKNRKKRIDIIVELIRSQCIGSQEELAHLLSEQGHSVTQATLSRDLKLLRTTKVPTDRGTYMYVLPDSDSLKDKILTTGILPPRANYHSGFLSIAFSRNLVVIKTRIGYASGLAYEIDVFNASEVVGTIPATDTILIVMREDVSRERTEELFAEILNLPIEQIRKK